MSIRFGVHNNGYHFSLFKIVFCTCTNKFNFVVDNTISRILSIYCSQISSPHLPDSKFESCVSEIMPESKFVEMWEDNSGKIETGDLS